jgi:maltose alpha-D-glucosyltransferase/alpha-amylase
VHVRAFYDSDGDGIGDFPGLTDSLDYIQDLGVDAIWLLPFYPSPLKDDGYDISNFTDVHPDYGTLNDFKLFLREAHRRGLRVITELILNHTSDQHEWFQRARRSPPGSRWRNYYVWSDTPDKYKDARIIFKDFESSNWAWDPVAKAYYWHRFYSHQPDLNYDSPDVQKAMLQITDFWLGLGVDGLRLDAVPYLYEREGSSCENLPETHEFIKQLRRHIDRKFENKMLLAEANQWPEDVIAYFGSGDECQVAFNFPVMPRLFMGIHMENSFPIMEILQRTPQIPETCQWALFLRNHDELSLEMVTDEERDYMYRVYADDPHAKVNLGIRRRLAPLMGDHRRKIELMNGLLFSLPGTPVIYYGDEIGMGDNYYLGDRQGVRTPMQWSGDRNAGFSRANPQRLYSPVITDPEYHYETVNVEAQQRNPNSLLSWMKQLILARKRNRAFGRGTTQFLSSNNRKVLAFVRSHQDERALVIANLSRFAQYAVLNLSELKGMRPLEFFGRTPFPTIGEAPYLISLGPYEFFWFALEPAVEIAVRPRAPQREIALLRVKNGWEGVFSDNAIGKLGPVIGTSLANCRWFGGKARTIRGVNIFDAIPVPKDSTTGYITLLNVEYDEGDSEDYSLPLSYAAGKRSSDVADQGLARLEVERKGSLFFEEGVLYDAIWNRAFCTALVQIIANNQHVKGRGGEVVGEQMVGGKGTMNLQDSLRSASEPKVAKVEQSNTSILFGDRLFLKLLRHVGRGVNPELEVGRFLTEKAQFPHTPALLGSVSYRPAKGPEMALAILYEFVMNQGDAWQYTLGQARSFFDRATKENPRIDRDVMQNTSYITLIDRETPSLALRLIGPYLGDARLLGQRTAEFHVALAEDHDDPAFSPEPFSHFYQRALYHEMLRTKDHTLQLLRQTLNTVPPSIQEDAQKVLTLEGRLEKSFQPMRDRDIAAVRIRTHGDFHLGQVLYTGMDFVIIDFEGEPARPLSERRLKRSPLRDVAGMLRSFEYASYISLPSGFPESNVEADSMLLPWRRFWHRWVSASFLSGYFSVSGIAALLPHTPTDTGILLDAYVTEKLLYELAYELNNRPPWVRVPLNAILELLSDEKEPARPT